MSRIAEIDQNSGYYRSKRKGVDCVPVSLANLLLERKDAETATLVVDRTPDSSYRFPQGFPFPATPAVIRDLTDGRYDGELFLSIKPGDDIRDLNSRALEVLGGSEKGEKICGIIEEEIDSGRVEPIAIGVTVEYNHPALLMVESYFGTHVVVSLDDEGRVVNDGSVQRRNTLIKGICLVEKL